MDPQYKLDYQQLFRNMIPRSSLRTLEEDPREPDPQEGGGNRA